MLNPPAKIHYIFCVHFFSNFWYFRTLEAVPSRSLVVLSKVKATVYVCSRHAPCHQALLLA